MGDKKEMSCCCGPGIPLNEEITYCKEASYISGAAKTAAGDIPRVATELTRRDKLGTWMARWGIRRMSYRVRPGLYAVGNPDGGSPVFVTANYKMSFDRLRKELKGINGWIMVLDTKGINVWCAAGKGTFATAEVVHRVSSVRLPEVVTHRKLILPQLAAPGVAAHEVLKQTGFKVIFGPARAEDLPAFLRGGLKATEEMRRVRFGFRDRLVLVPVDLVGTLRFALPIFGVLLIVELFLAKHSSFTLTNLVPFLGAIIAGSVLTPLLLPWIPGRAFAWKGWLMGLLWALALGAWHGHFEPTSLLILPALSAFLAMNFTGSSAYTSLSGVLREMRIAVPLIIISAGAGVIVFIVRFLLRS